VHIVSLVLAVGGVVAWMVAFLAATAMTRLRAEGVTLLYLATHGHAFFDSTRFKPEAEPHRRRFLRACLAFVVLVALAAVTAALGG
jgi:hypothetical protein